MSTNQPGPQGGHFECPGRDSGKKNGYLVAISTGQASASSFTFLSCKITMSVLDQIKQYTTIVADSGDFESKYTAAAVVRPKVAPGNWRIGNLYSHRPVQTPGCYHQPLLDSCRLPEAPVWQAHWRSCCLRQGQVQVRRTESAFGSRKQGVQQEY